MRLRNLFRRSKSSASVVCYEDEREVLRRRSDNQMQQECNTISIPEEEHRRSTRLRQTSAASISSNGSKYSILQFCLESSSSELDSNLASFLDTCLATPNNDAINAVIRRDSSTYSSESCTSAIARVEGMDAMNLQDDIIEFLEEKALKSSTFESILECTDIYEKVSVRYPPASSRVVAKLPVTHITAEDRAKYRHYNEICVLYSKRLIDGNSLCKVPCGHVYHRNCLVFWMGYSCACPLCLYEVETSHPLFEIGRRQRMAQRSIPPPCRCPSTHRCSLPAKADHEIIIMIETSSKSKTKKSSSIKHKSITKIETAITTPLSPSLEPKKRSACAA